MTQGARRQSGLLARMKGLAGRAGREANDVRVPMTQGRLGMVELARRTAKDMGEDHTTAFAASLAFRGLMAIFPFSLLVVSVLGAMGQQQLLTDLLDQFGAALPQEAVTLLRDQVFALTDPDKAGLLTTGAIVGALLALWGLSGAMRAVMEATNVMYDVSETRGLVARYVRSIVLSLGVVALFVSALVLVVAGRAIAEWIAGATQLGDAFVTAWTVLQWPLLVLAVLLGFALMYWAAPDVEQDFRYISPGSIVASVGWLVFSLLFALYANNFGSFDASYGALAGVIVLLLYLYWSSLLLLAGAQLNQVIEEAAPGGKDEGERRVTRR